MYREIYVPIDNSEWSHRAIDVAVALGRAFGARLTGAHVYAARLHEQRFRQMEPVLPAPYREGPALERQRATHASLIARGLRLVSESYLDVMAGKAQAAGLAFERRVIDGTHWRALVEDVHAGEYDLLVMGALGMGEGKEVPLGSVTLRVLRKVPTDILVVRSGPAVDSSAPIAVCLDGSSRSVHALRVAIALARALGLRLAAVSVYDPDLHYAMFRAIANVLSAEAARLFRFREQGRLHEEIIDAGLARIYRGHLDQARRLAAAAGVDVDLTLFAGRCVDKVLAWAREEQPWLVVAGRTGIHSGEGETDLGATAENLVRLLPTNVLVVGRDGVPPAGGCGGRSRGQADDP